MLSQILFPDLPHLQVIDVNLEETRLTLTLKDTQSLAACSLCGVTSTKIQSQYIRTVADLPVGERNVQLRLTTRRFWCLNAMCERQIFAERFNALVATYARRSIRQAARLTQWGLVLGGEGGAALAARSGLVVSSDTILRLLHAYILPQLPTPQLLGVDDWAFKKGQSYGTILVDLATRCPVDLLKDRHAQTLADWLREHPGVEVITRDRAGAYAQGASEGAPLALQVADRFHLLQNLSGNLKEVFVRQPIWLNLGKIALTQSEAEVGQASQSGAVQAQPIQANTSASTTSPSPSRLNAQARRGQQMKHARRKRRLERYEEVVELHKQQHSQTSIAAITGLHRNTVKRYLEADQFVELPPRPKRVGKLCQFETYLKERWQAGQKEVKSLFGELVAQGYRGGLTNVYTYINRELRGLSEEQLRYDPTLPKAKTDYLSPRGGAWLLIAPPAKLKAFQQEQLQRLLEKQPQLGVIYELVQDFRVMLLEHRLERWGSWLTRAKSSQLAPILSFAAGLERDEAAVKAAIISQLSNGQVEGQVNRLKVLKRQMYGRASFELLKIRVLARTTQKPVSANGPSLLQRKCG